jgi:Domain of unknown function (DUF2383)
MLLRDDRQVALGEVETLCREAGEAYARAAGTMSDPGLAQLFSRLGGQHRQLAAELAAPIRALDDLPQQPDPDRKTVEYVFTGIKALLAGDGALVEEQVRVEDRIAATAQAALRLDWPSPTEDLLRRVLTQSATARNALAATRA